MLGSFKDRTTRRIFNGEKVAGLDQSVYNRARRKLQQLEAATSIEDLYFPPSNKLHALQGYSPTRYSIRINQQWRVSFEWWGDRAENVLFEDYHR
jgi:proteic killer suppression protein